METMDTVATMTPLEAAVRPVAGVVAAEPFHVIR